MNLQYLGDSSDIRVSFSQCTFVCRRVVKKVLGSNSVLCLDLALELFAVSCPCDMNFLIYCKFVLYTAELQNVMLKFQIEGQRSTTMPSYIHIYDNEII